MYTYFRIYVTYSIFVLVIQMHEIYLSYEFQQFFCNNQSPCILIMQFRRYVHNKHKFVKCLCEKIIINKNIVLI